MNLCKEKTSSVKTLLQIMNYVYLQIKKKQLYTFACIDTETSVHKTLKSLFSDFHLN